MKKVKLKLELQYNSPVILTFFLLSLLVLFLDQWTDDSISKSAIPF